MVKKLTFGSRKNRSQREDKNHIFVKVMTLPTLAIILNLTATSVTRAKPVSSRLPKIAQSSKKLILSTSKGLSQGTQISLNGRTLPGAWIQQKSKNNTSRSAIYISDGALRQLVGVDLLSSNSPQQQPVQWFSSNSKPQILPGFLNSGYRYLDITKFARKAKWNLETRGNTLIISTPSARVKNINQDQPSSQQQRLVVNLDRPTPWKLTAGSLIKKPKTKPLPKPKPKIPVPQLPFPSRNIVIKTDTPPSKPKPPAREWIITIDGVADRELVKRYTPTQSALRPIQISNPFQKIPLPISPKQTDQELIKQVEIVNNQTVIRLVVPFGLTPRVSTLPKPDRLVVDVRPDALVGRSIDWAKGLR
ncbi:MAG: hypothetical protein MJK14_05605, partial [Rivularia sp. ALOHA_DT_140]|nr:hypothetical protein [Rivularia sp. ALOHA_DT_140]